MDRPLETSTTVTLTVLPFLDSPTRPTQSLHSKSETRPHSLRAIERRLVFIFIIVAVHSTKHHDQFNISSSNSSFFFFVFVSVCLSFLAMQQLSNDTGSWNLIDSVLPSPLFSNSNTYDALANVGAGLDDAFSNGILPIALDPLISLTTHSVTLESSSANYWAFALIIFPIFTIVGNVLVVVSVYREKSLHTITNYFVVSLAISDITVAAVVMPFAIYLEVSRSDVPRNRPESCSQRNGSHSECAVGKQSNGTRDRRCTLSLSQSISITRASDLTSETNRRVISF